MKNYWRQYIVWVGVIVALIPLSIIMHLQYRSLRDLEQTSAVSYKMAVKTYLKAVISDLEEHYRTNAESVLAPLAAEIIKHRDDDVIQFTPKCWGGTKEIFVVTFDDDGDSKISFYNPETESIDFEPDAREKRAINSAATPWQFHRRFNSPIGALSTRTLTVNELDPDNRLILKPIVDDTNAIIGIAGLIIDSKHFQAHLKQSIRESLTTVFPEDNNKILITVRDNNKSLIMKSCELVSASNNDEVWVALPFVFTDWTLGYQRSDITIEQLAHRSFIINFTVSIFMCLILITGIIITMRAISREMRLSQMKTDFVSNVSHELRTPLSSIRVFGEFMRLGWVKDHAKILEYGEYIETESRRLTQLIDNILDFSRISSNRKLYQMEFADLGNIVQMTLKSFEVLQKQHGYQISLEYPAELLPLVRIDAAAIGQAFVNLLDNAIKYSRDSKEIRVKLARAADYLTISITDEGVGIARQEQTKIFDKFYRVSTGLVHDIKGSGLGLSIVKHIIDAHHGKVTVESAPGKGSTFTIYLPIEKISNPVEESYVERSNC